jgi:hypothetical protein
MDRTVRPSRPYTIGLLPRPSSMTTLPSARGHCVRAWSYPPAPINLHLCPTRVRRSRGRTKSPRLVPRVHAWSPCSFPPVRARSYPPAPINLHLRPMRIRTQSRTREESALGSMRPRPFPPVRTRSYPPAPISTRSRPTRSHFYQRAYAGDRAIDQCAPAIISHWRPL